MTFLPRVARRFAFVFPFLLLAPQNLAAQSTPVAGDVQVAVVPEPDTQQFPRPESLQEESETPWIYENSDVPRDEEWLFGKLDNGLRYGVRKNGVPPGQVSIRVRIDAGSLHEEDDELGYAHLLEHLLFRESKFLGQSEAIRAWQRLGATFGSDTNAETSPTHTVYKLDLPNVDIIKLDESMKLLSGMVRDPVLSDANVLAEVPIVLAEKRERGGIAERVAEQRLQTLFAGQRLAERIIIGTEDSLEGASGASVQAFYDRWYRPENTVISVVGDLDPLIFAAMIEKYFVGWTGDRNDASAPDFGDPLMPSGADPANPVGDVSVIVEPTMQRFFTYGYFRPWRQVDDTVIYNEGRLRETLALQLINRRLEAKARAGKNLLEADVSEAKISRSTHATIVNFVPLTEDWESALVEVRGVIADALINPPTQEEMDRELAEMEVAYTNEVEQRVNRAGALYADELIGAVDIREAIAAPETFLMVFNSMREKATPQMLLEETRKLFSGNVIRATYVTPDADDATDAQLKAALLAPVEADADARLAARMIDFADLPPVGPPGEIVAREPHAIGNVERIEFDNGVTALVLANDHEPGRVAVKVRFGAGMRAFDPEDAPYVALGEAALVSSGLADLGAEGLDRLATGRKLGFDFSIGEGVFSFDAMTRKQDLEDQLYLFAAKLGMPRWDEAPFERAKAAAELAYKSYASQPGGVLTRDLEYLLYDENPVFMTSTPETLQQATLEGFREVWEPILSEGPVEVLVFGDFDREKTIEALSRTFGALPDRGTIPPEVLAREFDVSSGGETVVRYHQGDANQAAAAFAWPVEGGMGGTRKSRQLTILTEVFNNRLMDAMRLETGASYAPSVQLDWPMDIDSGGSILGFAQMQPKDVPVLFEKADQIAKDLTETPPTTDELARATEPLRNRYERIATSNYFLLLELQGSTQDPRRMRALRGFLNDYSETTPETMLALAREYFGGKASWRMAVIPEGQSLATASTMSAQSGR